MTNLICSRIESALKSVTKKQIDYQHQLKELEVGDAPSAVITPTHIGAIQSKLTYGLNNFRTIDTLLQEVSAGLQVCHIFSLYSKITEPIHSATPKELIGQLITKFHKSSAN